MCPFRSEIRLGLEVDTICLFRGLLRSFPSFLIHSLQHPETQRQQDHRDSELLAVYVVYTTLCTGVQPLLHVAGTSYIPSLRKILEVIVICSQGSAGADGFANETNKLFVADCVVSVTDFIGDLILIYRCWVIWSKNPWVTILPLLCAAGGLSASPSYPLPYATNRRLQFAPPSLDTSSSEPTRRRSRRPSSHSASQASSSRFAPTFL